MLGQLDWEDVVFTIDDVSSWENVLETAKRLQGLEVSEDFYVTYKDEEGDVINVKNEVDLAEAARWAQEQGIPCLCLHVPFSSADTDSDDDSWMEVDGSPRGAKPASVTLPVADTFHLNDLDDTVPEEEHPMVDEPHDCVREVMVTPETSAVEPKDEHPTDVLQVEDIEEEPVLNKEVHVVTPILEVFQEVTAPEEIAPQVEDAPAPKEIHLITPIMEVFQEEAPAPVPAVEEPEQQQPHLDNFLGMLYSVNEPSTEKVDGKELLVKICSNEQALKEVLKFLSHEAVQSGIVTVANAAPDAALKTATAQLIKAVYKHPDVFENLSRIPNVEQILTQTLRKLKIKPSGEETTVPQVVARANHEYVTCDGCESNLALKDASAKAGYRNDRGEIVGIRYKSAVLPDYDLCEACEGSGRFQQKAGPFLKIVDPATAPDVILCVLPGASAGMSSQLDALDWRNPVAKEFLEFVQSRRQRAFPQQRPQAPKAKEPVPTTSPVVVAQPTPPPAPAPAVPLQAASTTEVRQELRCKHLLKTFETPHTSFSCDICGHKQPAKALMHGCRSCNFDVCQACTIRDRFLQSRVDPTQVTSPVASVSAPVLAPVPAPVPEQTMQASAPQAKFVSDVTLADGCVVRPGERLVKTWRVRNTGKERWPAGTRIGHVGQDALGGPLGGVEVPLAAPGEAVNVSVPLVMPTQPGRYTSFWRMLTPHPQNSQFGHRFWVTVNVVAPPSDSPVAFPGVIIRPPPPPPPPQSIEPTQAPEVLPEVPMAVQVVSEELSPEFQTALAQIADFGFMDVEKIVSVLKEVNGDTGAAIDKLLEDA